MKCKYWSQDVEDVVELIKELYKIEGAGGMLHIVVDDGNLEADHIQWCIDYCNQEENANRQDKELCLKIAHKMLQMSYEKRVLAYYMPHRFQCNGNCEQCAVHREIVGNYWW
jgi:hypothetical protein